MRALLPTLIVGCLASCWALGLSSGALTTSGKPQTTPPPPMPSSTAADNAAAAKHARRTQCLQQAKLKKLIGAQRTAYVKDCMGGA